MGWNCNGDEIVLRSMACEHQSSKRSPVLPRSAGKGHAVQNSYGPVLSYQTLAWLRMYELIETPPAGAGGKTIGNCYP